VTGINFSSQGTRWCVTIVSPHMAAKPHVPPLPGPGLLFAGDDGTIRFLRLAERDLPSQADLQAKSILELGTLAQRATTLSA
jgi:hypothetical protein